MLKQAALPGLIIATLLAISPTAWADQCEDPLVNGAINGISYLQMDCSGDEYYIRNVVTNPDDYDFTEHEGLHDEILHGNVRYKEWYYIDLHTDDGWVVSSAIVFSIVDTHYFVWVYNPYTGEITEEIMRDAQIDVNQWGEAGVHLEGDDISIIGNKDDGYEFWFEGENYSGYFEYSDPVSGRAEQHRGDKRTYYGLYQVPQMNVSGTLTEVATEDEIDLEGEGYHDHWWGIINHHTKWKWVQTKYDNGWISGIYHADYDCGILNSDVHRYAWLWTPEAGYIYFWEPSLSFEEIQDSPKKWKISIAGAWGQKLEIYATERVERYEYKPVILRDIGEFLNNLVDLGGHEDLIMQLTQDMELKLGEVDYFQYPVTVEATYKHNFFSPTVHMNSNLSMLEDRWKAIW